MDGFTELRRMRERGDKTPIMMLTNLHTFHRTHEDAVAVEVRGKGHALLGDLAQLCEAEHLKSAAVGEDGGYCPNYLPSPWA